MYSIVVTPEVSHAPMLSLKEAARELHFDQCPCPQNKYSMSVTPEVSHVEMWPYVASAAVASASHAATAVLMLLSVMTLFTVGRGTGTGVGSWLRSGPGHAPRRSRAVVAFVARHGRGHEAGAREGQGRVCLLEVHLLAPFAALLVSNMVFEPEKAPSAST